MQDKILIVNDTPIINKVLKHGLESGGFDVDTVITGQEGVDKVKADRYDIILLDYNLPDINGDVVCGIIKTDSKNLMTPVYYISSLDKETMDQVIVRTGAQGYIDIAIDVDELCGKIKVILEG
ncbi:MAG: response regulator [Candidatus Omnitrophica bacterium]|nr:response regulator [Candidatus Omnitrophota bacterium]